MGMCCPEFGDFEIIFNTFLCGRSYCVKYDLFLWFFKKTFLNMVLIIIYGIIPSQSREDFSDNGAAVSLIVPLNKIIAPLTKVIAPLAD